MVNNDHLGDLGTGDKIKEGRIINIYKKSLENYKRNTMVGHMINSNMLILKEHTLIEISKHDILNLEPINVAKN